MKQIHLLIWITGVAILTILQWSVPLLWEADGYLHAQMAQMMWEKRSFLQSMPQLPFSFFASNFVDRDYIYHLLLIPFVQIFGLIQGAKVLAWLGGVFLWSTLVWLCRRAHPLLPLLFFLSASFLTTIARPRPMVLAFAGLPLIISFIVGRKTWKTFWSSLGLTMTHVTGPLAVGVAGLGVLVRHAKKGRGRWGTVLAAVCGVVLGMVIHPNFPRQFYYWYLVGLLIPWYATRWGVVELGAEFFPIPPLAYLVNYGLLPALALFFGFLLGRWRHNLSWQQIVWLITALGFFILSLRSARYAAQAYPLALIAFAQVWGEAREVWLRLTKGLQEKVQLAGLLVLLIAASLTMRDLKIAVYSHRVTGEHYMKAAQILQQTFPPATQVFHANWSDSQYLLGLAPTFRYLVTLDPTYMYQWNKDTYTTYREIAHGQQQNPVVGIRRVFGAQAVYTDKYYFRAFYEQMRQNPTATLVWEDNLGAIFRLD